MSKRSRLNLIGQYCYFITVVTHGRRPIFQDERIRKLWVKTLDYCHKKLRFILCGYTLLLDHFYFMIIPSEGRKIEDVIHHINGIFAISYNRLTGHKGQVVQRRFWDHVIRNIEDFEEKLNYMHFNPEKHNLVEDVEDWPYSSWHNYYCHHQTLIDVDFIDL